MGSVVNGQQRDAKKRRVMAAEFSGPGGPHEELNGSDVTADSGPGDPHEQGVVTIGAGPADPPPPPPPPPPASPKPRSKNGAVAETPSPETRLRFHVTLKIRLAKETEVAICVFSPDHNRGPVTVESLHLKVYKKGDLSFQDEVPVRKDMKIKPGVKKAIPLTSSQQKELKEVVSSKTIAVVDAVYTAPAETQVTISVEDGITTK